MANKPTNNTSILHVLDLSVKITAVADSVVFQRHGEVLSVQKSVGIGRLFPSVLLDTL